MPVLFDSIPRLGLPYIKDNKGNQHNLILTALIGLLKLGDKRLIE